MTAALRGLALALVYLFILQSSLSPLATLRMESTASIFGVRCVPGGDAPASDHAAPDHAAHGACCDAACLLHAQSAAAPPPVAILHVAASPRVARVVRFAAAHEDATPRIHGLRPQSQRAPPFA
jgi:hypothetical protein